jgi:hypothetical protein
MGDEMKKVCWLALFLVPILFAQQNNKGNISLVFNGEKIDLPIYRVSINKLDGITLNISAQQNDLQMHKKVALELKLKELSPNPDAEILEGTKIEIVTIDTTNSGNILSIRFGNESDSGFAHYVVLNAPEDQFAEIKDGKFEIII